MFKFKFIKWNKKVDKKSLIAPLPIKAPFLQEGYKNLEKKAITSLIIVDSMEKSIVGGMSLVKRELNHLQEDLRRLIPTSTSHQDYVWECFDIFCIHSPDQRFDGSESEYLFRNFFHSIYEGLVEFGKQNETGFVIVKLTAEAYPATKNLGLWPYIIQFLPKDCLDNFFYGILPLKGRLYEQYQKNGVDK